MKIISDDKRVINELSDYLNNKGVDSKIEKISNNSDSTTKPMGGLETYLSIGANFTTILSGVAFTINYINHNYPEWYVLFLPKKDELPMSSEEYEEMSVNAKRAVLENFDIRIKKK